MKTIITFIGILALCWVQIAQAQIDYKSLKKQAEQIIEQSNTKQPLPIEFGDTVKSYDGYESAIISEDGQQVLVKMSRPKKYGYFDFQVYQYKLNRWIKKGKLIQHPEDEQGFGRSFEMSPDGKVLFFGSPMVGPNLNEPGKMYVYTWNGMAWVSKDNPIRGSKNKDAFGSRIQYYPSCNYLIVSAPGFNTESLSSVGAYRVYTIQNNGLVQKGKDIIGRTEMSGNKEASFDLLDISDDGQKILLGNSAFGVRNKDKNGNASWRVGPDNGCVGTVVWKDNDWLFIEQELCGNWRDQFGEETSFSNNGNNLLVSASPYKDDGGIEGKTNLDRYAKYFEWNADTFAWVEVLKFDKTDLGIPERIRYIYLRNDTIRVTSSQTTHVFLISQGKLEPIGPLSNSDISDNCTPYISIDDWKSHDYGGVYYHPKVCVRFLKRYVNKETQHIIAFYNKI